MSRTSSCALLLPLVTLTGAVCAQHADFVLFGEKNEKGASQPAEQRFVHPVTAPYFHEDSFVTSDLRGWFVHHDFPKSSAIGGGDAQVAALQLRLALTDTIQLVAYKDGFITFDTPLVDESGLNDIAAGLKWNFLQDWDNQFHAAVGAGYEIRAGNGKVLQNDDEFRLWASANKGFDKLHLGGVVNVFFADDEDSGLGNSDWLSWHLHADYWVCEWFSPILEINGYHTMDEGLEVLPFSGVDVANFGGGEGEDVITAGLGGEFRIGENVALRGAYETPLTRNEDLFGWRWTFSVVYSF